MPSPLSILTNQLTGGAAGQGLFNLSIPSVTLDNIVSVEKDQVSSLSQLYSSVVDSVQNLNQLAHTAYCIGMVITDPAMLLNVLNQIAGSVAAVAYDMAQRIASLIENQILAAFGQIAGTILHVVTSVLNFLQALLNIYNAIKRIIENLSKLSLDNLDDFMSKEQCEMMLAMMGACLLNKLFGDKLNEFESKVTKAINDTGNKINDAISKELTDVNNMATYVDHEAFLMNKATEQLNLFTANTK